MASKLKKIIKLVSTKSKHFYTTIRNPKNAAGKKIELMKYDPTLKQHVLYKESKIK